MTSQRSDLFTEIGPNSGLVRDLYELYLQDPALVGTSWAEYFARYVPTDVAIEPVSNGALAKSITNGHASNGKGAGYQVSSNGTQAVGASIEAQARVSRLIAAYRTYGHFKAKINPLTQGVAKLPQVQDLDLESYGFNQKDLQAEFISENLCGKNSMPLSEILSALEAIYCSSIGFEYQHLVKPEQRSWLQSRIESHGVKGAKLNPEDRLRAYQKLVEGEQFEALLHKKYVGQKRFSLQGAETAMPMLDAAIERSADRGVKEVVVGMAHRGRINVLCNTIGKPLADVFTEFEDQSIYTVLGSGDVKYHKGYESEFVSRAGNKIKTMLAANPSHLEAVDPVVEGVVRAKQDLFYARDRKSVLPILIHGDAAFAGQGVVFETLNYSQVDGYKTGGTLHLVINNQVGFTTNPEDGRSTVYCTDMAKSVGAPVFHVNCEDVDAAQWVMQLAVDFCREFACDVIIDLYSYRKYGHNEGDDPSFTQPLTYSEVNNKKTITQVYAERLVAEGVFSDEQAKSYITDYQKRFEEQHAQKNQTVYGEACAMYGRLRVPTPATGVELKELEKIANTLINYPEGFAPHPKLVTLLKKRVQTLTDGKGIDWGFAEGLAFGSLVLEGHPVRLSGQDCGRGTFSQRHLALNHYSQPQRYLPFEQLQDANNPTARFEVYNSTLSEAAVVGFEFGYAAVATESLVLWEGQFGDFVNGAQIHIDQFISASESKWGQLSGVVLMLPHGYEGQGSEHSSGRLERFLQLCGEGNMCVCYPSNAAQHFHLLRRQGLMEIKRPLVIMTPKSLLRLPEASCEAKDLTSGQFQTVIEEQFGTAKGSAESVIFLTGKIYYEVAAALKQLKSATKVVRLEQLYPFPQFEVKKVLKNLKAKNFFWVQEEPQNMGAWTYLESYFKQKLSVDLQYIGRPAAASPATGSLKRHIAEQKKIIDEVLASVAAK